MFPDARASEFSMYFGDMVQPIAYISQYHGVHVHMSLYITVCLVSDRTLPVSLVTSPRKGLVAGLGSAAPRTRVSLRWPPFCARPWGQIAPQAAHSSVFRSPERGTWCRIHLSVFY